ncbi:MAG: hypothetical protein H7Z72_25180 [Bacteroidetes bacterium]|nr:hypothetical protein [Fibrella sp.]
MKKHILFCCLASIWLSGGVAQAQQWTFGPRLDLQLSSSNRMATLQIDDYNLSTTPSKGNREALGGFARYDQKRWYAQAEYMRGSFRVVMDGDKPGIGSISSGRNAPRQDIRLNAGVKPLPWLRLGGGITYARYNWGESEDGRIYESIRRQLLVETNPVLIEYNQKRLPAYNISRQIDAGYRRSNLEGSVGAGIDIGGLTLDLIYSRSLTPFLDGVRVNGTAYPFRFDYSYTTLRLGYRLFPFNAFVTTPRKRNPAYQRLKRDIPFYRNEFHVAGGLIGEDIGSAFTYENRYTRYITRRFGVTGGLNVTRVFETFDNGFLPKHYNAFQLVTGLRVLPLYSRRHIIGITAGPTLTLETGVSAYSGGGNPRPGGGYYNYVNWRADSRREGIALNWMSMIDYQFAATDRIVLGPWLRLNGIDYATLGIQAGYRF